MEQLGNLLKEMDFQFWGTGELSLNVSDFLKVLTNEHVFFLDVRAKEETKLFSYGFTHAHIPLHELPDRLNEVPKDKLIVLFCASSVRAGFAYLYLLEQGYAEVKVLAATTAELSEAFRPGRIYTMENI